MGDLLYISTNHMWSGSEELWVRSAKEFEILGLDIYFATKYNHPQLRSLKGKHINYSTFRQSRISKVIKRLSPSFNTIPNLIEPLIKQRPKLVIISQGNNIDSLDVMNMCVKNKVPYITVTQLVTEVHLLNINQYNLDQYYQAYSEAVKNFFVSRHNLQLNNLMLGTPLDNAEVVRNPCRVYGDEVIPYPSKDKGYQIGLVGRIECFHKGYDLLLQVLSLDKWRSRNLQFNIYGEGPHTNLIEKNLNRLKLSNVFLKGFTNNIKDVWKTNHLLCMPSRMEGQALSLIEAMYYARAAIVTDVGGAKELITDNVNGFIATAPTVEYIDNALENAWINRQNWENMGKLCQQLILESYSISAEIQLNKRIEPYLR